MRIALMTNNYKPFMGGVPISIERLKNGLEALGHQVTVFAPTYEEQVEEENVFRYATCMKKFIGGIVLPNPFDKRIEEEFKKRNFDIIHVHHPMLIGRTAVYLSRKYNIPLTFTYHTRYEQYVECYTKSKLIEKLTPLYLRAFLKHCHFVFAPTQGMKDYLVEVCKLYPERIGILPTGIEDANFQVQEEETAKIREQYQSQNMPLLITVSRMAQEKNVEFLLKSLALFKRRWGKPFRMLMIGDGPDRETYERTAADLGLAEEIRFTGKIPNQEIAPYFAAADGFLFASKTETQGIVILEAFAGKTPVIAVEASGVKDIVKSGYSGILTEEDTEQFAGELASFLENGQIRKRMEVCAGQSALAYREEAVALRAVHYYNSVINLTEGKEEAWKVNTVF
ncbi:MAG: glycosyltransferase family 4 protein [Lachnospiraceae bacterium]|nr:glycosyltransferase family 4 protein [Lachnospiraceae bacterium]